jgi:hypothetical protein
MTFNRFENWVHVGNQYLLVAIVKITRIQANMALVAFRRLRLEKLRIVNTVWLFLNHLYILLHTSLIITILNNCLDAQGLGASEKKKKKKKILFNTTTYKGANSLASIFLSRRVKLIVTSERLNIFKKCFHQSKVK